ncbi:DNA methyltransferase [Candidatus Epulonipiscium fishelsonii]|uniref:DNA methyltransferase n=1 Tax=Candidatus Epulonipiscium fishelsonii TaxID=77094 RepID=A0ACC8XDT2_9FIRM|nr:DNA methyltransferase [Epulopiscium sp. SCG-B05WGA-EpuloA1]ONI41050.1 DNA methyltransferase [Epulopiscium sp. SCG-B11WGA-EpuloA1]
MEKLRMETVNLTDRNIDKIAELFPNCVTEMMDKSTAKLKRGINFKMLKQMLSEDVVDGNEAYEFTWVGKKKAMIEANKPIRKTLRPCKEESVNWDTTENVYIEGDNLEVLKLLQEGYLGKVKMIYIDPPYNTGKDSFVYDDDFKQSKEEYEEYLELYEDGNRMHKNTDTNGRFHSDWCSMMYSRLRVAKNLLSDDGVIFISIDDNEVENLKKICDEIFGENNFVSLLATVLNFKGNNDEYGFAGTHEYTLVYTKTIKGVKFSNLLIKDNKEIEKWKIDEKGYYKQGANLKSTGINAPRSKRPNLYFPVYIDENLNISLERTSVNDVEVFPTTNDKEMSWRWSKSKMYNNIEDIIVKKSNSEISIYKKQRPDEEMPSTKPKSLFYKPEYSSGNGTETLKKLFNNKIFDHPKPIKLISDFIEIILNKDDIILDFFSGSATTAHAVMQLNAEDGGNRKFIMVQIPEVCDEKTEAYKAGYKNICEIGKERIRRASKKISEDNPDAKFDGGFRVFKVDSSNMKDVYFAPEEYTQDMLDETESNIKEDRTSLDLLFGCVLNWNLPLDKPFKTELIDGFEVHTYNGEFIACFDSNVSETLVKEIAGRKPPKLVFRDASFNNSPSKLDIEQIIKSISPDTQIRVL